MRGNSLAAALVLVVAALVILANSAFIVSESNSAIVLQFGAPVAEHREAGLKFKAPFVQNVVMIDNRNRELDQDALEVIAANQERLLVDAFARYRIVNPQQFYQTVRAIDGGELRLKTQMNQTVRRVLGEVPVDDIVSGRRNALMVRIRELLGASARDIGIEIIDVKIRRA
ncbi:MAG TPA: protease modulator HflC, partial [Parvularcula sp.]|nr:protease modulator HflC [Parvularcula sp.]